MTRKGLQDAPFSHLHNHSQFSVLQSTASIPDLVKAASKYNMEAVSITDHANMMGAFHFVSAVMNHNKAAKTKIEASIDSLSIKIGQELSEILIIY